MKHETMSKADDAPGAGLMPWRREEGRTAGDQRPHVLLLVKTEAHAPAVEACEAAGLVVQVTTVDPATLAEGDPVIAEADALVVELRSGEAHDLETLDRLVHMTAGKAGVIAAVEGLTVADTRAMLRSGAVDVVPVPFTAEDIRQSVEPTRRPVRPTQPRAQTPQRSGKVIAFLGALGGVGTTSIASQAGILWSANARVCFIDFDVQFGNCALFLDLRPSLTLGDLIEDSERLDPELLQSVAVRHASGLNVIASPVDMVPLEIVTNEFVDRVLRVARQAYDIVLIDLPTAWTEWSLRIVERADITCLVTNLTVPGIHQARRQLEIIEANGLMERLRTVANRVPVKMFGRVDLKETEAVLGRKIDFTVANDYPTMSGANDEGRPIGEIRSGSKIVKDVKALADALSETLAQPHTAESAVKS